MILLITAAHRVRECAARLSTATGEQTVIAQNLSEAATKLRTASYTVVIFDQHLIEAERNERGTVLAHLGDAVCLDINFALTGIDRLVQCVQSAVRQREHNLLTAREGAARSLLNELNGTLTALMLECGLAAEIPNLPPAASEKLALMQASVEKLSLQLKNAASAN